MKECLLCGRELQLICPGCYSRITVDTVIRLREENAMLVKVNGYFASLLLLAGRIAVQDETR